MDAKILLNYLQKNHFQFSFFLSHVSELRNTYIGQSSPDNRTNGECGVVSRYGVCEEGIRGSESLPPRNSAFLQGRLIAMGHAHEELIIKIKYCGERVVSLLFYSTTRSAETRWGATRHRRWRWRQRRRRRRQSCSGFQPRRR